MNNLLPEEAMRQIASKAIFEALEPTVREKLFLDALNILLTPKKEKDRWGNEEKNAKSPLQEVFEYQLRQASINIVNEYLTTDEVKTKLKTAIQQALDTVLTKPENEIGDLLANLMLNAIHSVKYNV